MTPLNAARDSKQEPLRPLNDAQGKVCSMRTPKAVPPQWLEQQARKVKLQLLADARSMADAILARAKLPRAERLAHAASG